ncbi:hypothetical protein [Nocardia sp. IFM 10818]
MLLETLVFWRIAASIDVDEHWLPLRPFMLTAAISAALAAVLLWRTRGTWRALAWAMAATSGVWTAGVVFYLLVLGGVGITW